MAKEMQQLCSFKLLQSYKHDLNTTYATHELLCIKQDILLIPLYNYKGLQ